MNLLVLLVLPVALGIAIGLATGGSIARLMSFSVPAAWLLWIAAGAQVMHAVTGLRWLQGAVFTLVLLWLMVSARRAATAERPAYGAIVTGLSANAVAIGLNGRMPYDPAAARLAGLAEAGETPRNVPANGGTHLAWLGDILPVPPLGAVVSLGDILIGVGIAMLVASMIRRHPRKPQGEVRGHAMDP